MKREWVSLNVKGRGKDKKQCSSPIANGTTDNIFSFVPQMEGAWQCPRWSFDVYHGLSIGYQNPAYWLSSILDVQMHLISVLEIEPSALGLNGSFLTWPEWLDGLIMTCDTSILPYNNGPASYVGLIYWADGGSHRIWELQDASHFDGQTEVL